MAKIAFVIRDISRGGACKMMIYYANIACEIFDEVYIISFGKKKNNVNGVKDAVKICMVNEAEVSNRVLRILNDIRVIRKAVLEIKPDVLIPFASGNTIFTYLAVPRYRIFVGTERGNPEKTPKKIHLLCKWVYSKCDYMLFQTNGAANHFFNGKNDKCRIIRNPYIDRNITRKINGASNKFIIVSMSRLAREKNIDIIIRAFAMLRHKEECELRIYGDGPEMENLVNLSKELGIESKILFEGNIDKIEEALSIASVYVLVSSGEGMPNSLIEAMGVGIPCITTMCMVGETNEIVQNEVNGLIVNKRDVNDLQDAIDRLIDDDELRGKIGRNALKIKDMLSDEVIHNQIRDFYIELSARI
ncbi:glycosyltransferase [Butyrivibrio sp. FC2001]|uniref:glycosyltransferase n=1 Tax=Butyrivibrio sp. FC2001 TaxID=1280671 RepID=UPI00040A5F78|nr:glycosyltransferase [Butyrivibrio sp. FC2001]